MRAVGRRLSFSLHLFTVTYAASGWCQAYPNRTIQLIVAYAAGGTRDIVARSISDKLGAAFWPNRSWSKIARAPAGSIGATFGGRPLRRTASPCWSGKQARSPRSTSTGCAMA